VNAATLSAKAASAAFVFFARRRSGIIAA